MVKRVTKNKKLSCFFEVVRFKMADWLQYMFKTYFWPLWPFLAILAVSLFLNWLTNPPLPRHTPYLMVPSYITTSGSLLFSLLQNIIFTLKLGIYCALNVHVLSMAVLITKILCMLLSLILPTAPFGMVFNAKYQ